MGAVDVCKVGDGFVDAAVAQIVDRAQAAQAYWGDFYMSLRGGSTPRAIYERLAELEEGAIDWKRVKLTFGDERCVPPDHPTSHSQAQRLSPVYRARTACHPAFQGRERPYAPHCSCADQLCCRDTLPAWTPPDGPASPW